MLQAASLYKQKAKHYAETGNKNALNLKEITLLQHLSQLVLYVKLYRTGGYGIFVSTMVPLKNQRIERAQ